MKVSCGRKVVNLVEEPVVSGAGIAGGGGCGREEDGVTGAEEGRWGASFSESTKYRNKDREKD